VNLPVISRQKFSIVALNPTATPSTSSHKHKSLICDKSVTTQNLEFLSYWYRKKRLQMHF